MASGSNNSSLAKREGRVFEGVKQIVNGLGMGYIGLPTALMMASHGIEVVGTNHTQGKLDKMNSEKTTFKEEELDELF